MTTTPYDKDCACCMGMLKQVEYHSATITALRAERILLVEQHTSIADERDAIRALLETGIDFAKLTKLEPFHVWAREARAFLYPQKKESDR